MFSLHDSLHDLGTRYQNNGPEVEKYEDVWIGITGRLEISHAAVLLAKLRPLEDELEERHLMAKLRDSGDLTLIYRPKPLHLQVAVAHVGYDAANVLVREKIAGRGFSLPINPRLERETIHGIAAVMSSRA